MALGEFVSDAWHHIQGELFPFLAEEVGPLGETHRRFVAVLDLAPVERHLHYDHRGVGHPPADRNARAGAFVAKAVWDLSTTRALIDRRLYDPTLRWLCGWCRVSEVPSESTFSRAFAWFAETRLPERMHGVLVRAAREKASGRSGSPPVWNGSSGAACPRRRWLPSCRRPATWARSATQRGTGRAGVATKCIETPPTGTSR